MMKRGERARVVSAMAFAAAVLSLGGGLLSLSCARHEPPRTAVDPALAPKRVDPPAPPGASHPTIAAELPTTITDTYQLLMTWVDPQELGGALRFSRTSAGVWTRPVTVVGRVGEVGPGDRASLTVIDTPAVRRTLIARTGDVVARSGDAGRTWNRLPAPALPFASFAGGEEGGFAFWIEGEGSPGARLLGARVLAGGTELDGKVAAGSGTSAAMTWDGPVVVYRRRGTGGAPRIGVVTREEARWTRPRTVEVNGWRPGRSPVSGPQVAALKRQVAVAWHSEAPSARVLVAFSSDAGRTFGEPVEVVAEDDAKRVPTGAVDVTLDDSGVALVLWRAAAPGGGRVQLNLARVSDAGERGEAVVLARGGADSVREMPQITRAGERVAVTWVEGTPGTVRVLDIPLAGVPPVRARPEALRAKRSGRAGDAPLVYRGEVGSTAPDQRLRSLAGDEVSLADLRGQPVLLNLWATWCLPCIAEMPELVELYERYRPRGLEVVGLSVDSAGALDRVREFVDERSLPFRIWLDPESLVYRALLVRALPSTFLIDRDGVIVWRRDVAITADDPELRAALDRALAD